MRWITFFSQTGSEIADLSDFVDKHTQAMLNIEPRLEALETPIEDPKKTTYNNGYYDYTRTEIKVVDNA